MVTSKSSVSSRIEVHSLVELFRQALLAVGPLAEKAGVAWLQEPPYDDWEVIADGMFDGFVRSAILNSTDLDELRLTAYGFAPAEGEAFLATDDDLAFIRLPGEDRTLSAVLLVDPRGQHYETRRWDGTNFALRLPDGNRITNLDVAS